MSFSEEFSSVVAVVTGKDNLVHTTSGTNVPCVFLTLMLLAAILKKRK